jgi:fructose-1-phosphate kinase PfkB-like protein
VILTLTINPAIDRNVTAHISQGISEKEGIA